MMHREGETERDWWVSMPKVELHAHLNGSIRNSTLLELARGLSEKGTINFADVEHVILKDHRSLSEVFKLFDLIHIITTDHDTITRIAKEVVEDFAAENVVYLELRTTPKKNDSIGMTKLSYMEAVLKGLRAVSSVDIIGIPRLEGGSLVHFPLVSDMQHSGNKRKKIYVKILLSIDRRETTAAAMETINLALKMKDLGVAGIDLSGNPVVGEWMTFLPALEFAREQGLPITLHCGEVPNQSEIQAMLNFLPERIGHACCFQDIEWGMLKSSKIPVEICLTSNILTSTISSIDSHHFVDLYNVQHPLALCTDDSGVFSTSLSGEYLLAASAFGLGKGDLFQLAKSAIEFIFSGEEVKTMLKEIFDSASRELHL